MREIRGISATKGGADPCRSGFHMNLDRLPETMWLSKGENYGPFSDAEMTRLRAAVRDELPFYDGRLHLTLQTWDGAYIVHNSSASRQFALLRRLSRNECFPAEVKPISLSMEALNLLRERWRLVVLAQCSGMLTAQAGSATYQRNSFGGLITAAYEKGVPAGDTLLTLGN